MTNWGFDNSDPSSQDPNTNGGPKALRDAYDALKAKNEELAAGLATMQTEIRQQKVQAVFDNLGVPGAAPLYQGDADPAKVTEWATSMKTIFGGQGTPSTPPVDGPSSALGADAAAQLERMNNAGQSGTPLGAMEMAQASVNDATDIAGLIASFSKLH